MTTSAEKAAVRISLVGSPRLIAKDATVTEGD